MKVKTLTNRSQIEVLLNILVKKETKYDMRINKNGRTYTIHISNFIEEIAKEYLLKLCQSS